MGQYFKIINVDKQEQISPYDFDNLAKLMEFSYEGNNYIMALYKLLENRWKGDRVYITGDYDDEINEYHKDTSYYNIYKQLEKEFKTKSLYNKSDNWRFLYKKDISNFTKEKDYIRIYNTETRQYVNLTSLPVEWVYEGGMNLNIGKIIDSEIVSISPLSLLITFGNGSGGSFYSEDKNKMNLVGSWCE